MKRREFITALGGVAAAWPLAGGRSRLAGCLASAISQTFLRRRSELMSALREGLRERGYVEGQNLTIRVPLGHGIKRDASRRTARSQRRCHRCVGNTGCDRRPPRNIEDTDRHGWNR